MSDPAISFAGRFATALEIQAAVETDGCFSRLPRMNVGSNDGRVSQYSEDVGVSDQWNDNEKNDLEEFFLLTPNEAGIHPTDSRYVISHDLNEASKTSTPRLSPSQRLGIQNQDPFDERRRMVNANFPSEGDFSEFDQGFDEELMTIASKAPSVPFRLTPRKSSGASHVLLNSLPASGALFDF